MRAEYQVGCETDQAVPPAHRTALDRFEQEIAAAGLEKLQRGADRRFGIGNDVTPDERGAPIPKRPGRRRVAGSG